jgi:hypothetical protein
MNSVIAKTPPSALSLTIDAMLRALEDQEAIEWGELEKACDVPRSGLYSAVRSARKRLLHEGLKFRTLSSVGIMRINDNDVAEFEIEKVRQGIGRRARRLKSLAEAVDITQITEENKVKVFGASAIATITMKATQSKTMRAIGAGADPKQLMADSLEALKKRA